MYAMTSGFKVDNSSTQSGTRPLDLLASFSVFWISRDTLGRASTRALKWEGLWSTLV